MSLRVCGTVFTVKNSKSSHLKYCYCVLQVWRVDESAVSFIMILPSTRTCSTIMLYISSATNDPWPHPLHFYFLLLFLFVSHYQDSFSKTHNHLCSCSYHPEILTCVSSVLLLNVHTWMNVCCSCSFCDSWGSYIVCFLNENMVKPVQNDAVIV